MNYQITYAVKRILSDVARTIIFVGVDVIIARHQNNNRKSLYYNRTNKNYYNNKNNKQRTQYMREKYRIGG